MSFTDRRLAAAWAENALPEVRALKSIDELNDWIVTNNQKLGGAHELAPSAWNALRNELHQRDRDLREIVRQGVG
jgi:hypothetical protein